MYPIKAWEMVIMHEHYNKLSTYHFYVYSYCKKELHHMWLSTQMSDQLTKTDNE